MKYSFLVLLSFMFTLTVLAQGISVTGKLVSSDNNGLPYATISIANSTSPSVSIKKFATKEDGTFSIDLEKDQYILIFNCVGMDDTV